MRRMRRRTQRRQQRFEEEVGEESEDRSNKEKSDYRKIGTELVFVLIAAENVPNIFTGDSPRSIANVVPKANAFFLFFHRKPIIEYVVKRQEKRVAQEDKSNEQMHNSVYHSRGDVAGIGGSFALPIYAD